MDEDIDHRSQVIIGGTEAEYHLQGILQSHTHHGGEDHSACPFIPFVLPPHVQTRGTNGKGIDEHEYKASKLK